jgi:hypothetical protein
VKRVAILVAASPSEAFYSQIAAMLAALRRIEWADWMPGVYVYVAGHDEVAAFGRWRPYLRDANFCWSSDRRFANEGDWAQSDDVFRCAPRDADVLVTMDADTFPVASLVPVLDEVLERAGVAGVIAHYPFPRYPGTTVRDSWRRVADGLVHTPLDFAFSHSLMPPETPVELRATPYYVNGGVVFFAKRVFNAVATACLDVRPRLITRMPDPDFSGQAALALAIARCDAPTMALPMRYNFPNDPIADTLYPDELARVTVFHYLRTDAFDRQQIFASAEAYRRFLSLPRTGSNELLQRRVRDVLGSEYPFAARS